MAIFPSRGRAEYNGVVGKTHTNLVVSEGNAPAEQYLVSRDNPATPFIYEYGPEGNQTVLIAKGKIVESLGEELNRELGFRETAIRVAGEGTIRAIGVNHHNVYEQSRGGMDGNRATVLRNQYIEVPLFEHEDAAAAATTAEAMRFGAAYATNGGLRSGDYVVTGVDGNFKKFDENEHHVLQIVGQVLNVARDLPPAGLLQYYTGLNNAEMDAFLKQAGHVPGAVNSLKPYGAPYSVGSWKPEFIKALAGGEHVGIPFLTDGYFSAAQLLTNIALTDDAIEAVRPGDHVDVDGSNISVTAEVESMVAIKVAHKLDPRNLDQLVVKVGGVPVDKRDVRIDEHHNTVIVYLDKGEYANVTLDIPAVVNPTAGIPTEWDYNGSVGAIRVKLTK